MKLRAPVFHSSVSTQRGLGQVVMRSVLVSRETQRGALAAVRLA